MRAASPGEKEARLHGAMRLALVVGFILLAIKVGAYVLTKSTAILGDALESVVHIAAVLFAFFSLRLSLVPADAKHRYGHGKITFFSAAVEGGIVAVTGVAILIVAFAEIVRGPQITTPGWGLVLAATAGVINLVLGNHLLRTGKQHGSFILVANGKHVLVDSITTGGVLAGLALVLVTGWTYWDPIVAAVIGVHVGRSGIFLVRKGVAGLMDAADPEITNNLDDLLQREAAHYGGRHHALRHRSLGDSVSVEYHLLLPGGISLDRAHEIATAIEKRIQDRLPEAALITTHVEPIETHHSIHSAEEDSL